ncbi:MAG: membrane protein insertase YidC [Oscillibacter sp.]|jgi:YidC/Oxa1 family membrane protein insertase|nr:membrane protein insertase YidC [Oscillibacter sp.]
MGVFATIGYYICIPFAALLRLFYTLTGSYGISLILFTLVIKLILLPFQMKSKKSMMRMSRMNGQIKDIQKRYANNPTKMNEEMQRLYQEEGVNPMSGCLWSFLPLPILMALYYIIRKPITYFMMLDTSVVDKAIKALSDIGVTIAGTSADKVATVAKELSAYGEIDVVTKIQELLPNFASSTPGWINMNFSFLGIDLSIQPTTALTLFKSGITWAAIGLILIPFVSAAFQVLTMKFSMATQPQAGATASTNKMMMWMMPLMSLWIAFTLPAALGIYWIAQSAFSALQEFLLNKFYTGKLSAEEEEHVRQVEENRRQRQEEAKRLQEERKAQQAKISLKEKQRLAREAKAKPKKASTNENGRIGDRPYARGRAYSEDHYADSQNTGKK